MGKNINDLMKANMVCNVTEVDLATDADVTVSSGACILHGVHITTAFSAHAVPVKDSTTVKFTLPASQAVGHIDCHKAEFATSLIIESNDSATGKMLVFWSAI